MHVSIIHEASLDLVEPGTQVPQGGYYCYCVVYARACVVPPHVQARVYFVRAFFVRSRRVCARARCFRFIKKCEFRKPDTRRFGRNVVEGFRVVFVTKMESLGVAKSRLVVKDP